MSSSLAASRPLLALVAEHLVREGYSLHFFTIAAHDADGTYIKCLYSSGGFRIYWGLRRDPTPHEPSNKQLVEVFEIRDHVGVLVTSVIRFDGNTPGNPCTYWVRERRGFCTETVTQHLDVAAAWISEAFEDLKGPRPWPLSPAP